MARSRIKCSLSSVGALAVATSIVLGLAVPASASHGPGTQERPGAVASGWKHKCNKKRTKAKRRACKARHRLNQLAGDFSGSLSTTIRYLTFCYGDLGSETYQLQNVRVSVRAPLRPTPLSPDLPPPVGNENNPINLVVGETTPQANIDVGSVFVASAFRYGATSPGVILQYWNLTLNGATLSGTLVSDHREEAAAANLLSAWKELGCGFGWYPNQYEMSEGTTLTGTLTRNSVQLRITGSTFDGSRPFVTDITANRAG